MRAIDDLLDTHIDSIVIESLKESVLLNRHFEEHKKLDDALLLVLDYYMDPDAYQEFVDSITPAA